MYKILKSRHPIWKIKNITDKQVDMWKKSWKDGIVLKIVYSTNDPTKRVPGFELSRAMWTILNRFRTKQGNCKFLLHKWKIINNPLCEQWRGKHISNPKQSI